VSKDAQGLSLSSVVPASVEDVAVDSAVEDDAVFSVLVVEVVVELLLPQAVRDAIIRAARSRDAVFFMIKPPKFYYNTNDKTMQTIGFGKIILLQNRS
jgi:hypothetical protein